MYRKPSLAEVRYRLNDPSIQEKDGTFWRQFSDSLKISFPTFLPLDQDHNLVWPRQALDSQDEPELKQYLTVYPGAESLMVTAGKFDGQTFHLTGARDCEHVLLRVTLYSSIISADQSLESDFAQRYGALWYYHDAGSYEFDKFYNANDYWILPTPDSLRPLLNQRADKFATEMCSAEAVWIDYGHNKRQIRAQIEAKLTPLLESGKWGWDPHADRATLYYLKPSGEGGFLEIFYTDVALREVENLIQNAENL